MKLINLKSFSKSNIPVCFLPFSSNHFLVKLSHVSMFTIFLVCTSELLMGFITSLFCPQNIDHHRLWTSAPTHPSSPPPPLLHPLTATHLQTDRYIHPAAKRGADSAW